MDISTFETRLNELLNEINDMPAGRSQKLISLAKQAKIYNEKLQKSTETLHDSLDHLRLTVKYLLFDLEATRRENQYLRKMLEKGED
jgi:regulator of replication initiation timing